jgi:hypothetical protein
MWQLASLAKYDRRLREFNRKHSPETVAVLANLAKYMGALNDVRECHEYIKFLRKGG